MRLLGASYPAEHAPPRRHAPFGFSTSNAWILVDLYVEAASPLSFGDRNLVVLRVIRFWHLTRGQQCTQARVSDQAVLTALQSGGHTCPTASPLPLESSSSLGSASMAVVWATTGETRDFSPSSLGSAKL